MVSYISQSNNVVFMKISFSRECVLSLYLEKLFTRQVERCNELSNVCVCEKTDEGYFSALLSRYRFCSNRYPADFTEV